ncbi:hypothetical protein BKP42_68310 [Rhodococcus erythropolis]|nr:hypothetical protein BKP42_68310 [Rhodococcus erythropolis]
MVTADRTVHARGIGGRACATRRVWGMSRRRGRSHCRGWPRKSVQSAEALSKRACSSTQRRVNCWRERTSETKGRRHRPGRSRGSGRPGADRCTAWSIRRLLVTAVGGSCTSVVARVDVQWLPLGWVLTLQEPLRRPVTCAAFRRHDEYPPAMARNCPIVRGWEITTVRRSRRVMMRVSNFTPWRCFR